MKALYFDCFSGISGDMSVGALLSLGVPFEYLKQELGKLEIEDEYELSFCQVTKCGIEAGSFDVHLTGHHHHHDHDHHHGRNYKDIKNMIENSALSDSVKQMATGIFFEVAKAEAKVHGKNIDEVHFHEVGAVDSIVDIVGAAICINYLEIEKVFVSDLTEGSGFVNCQHGTIPVPVPATVEIAANTGLVLSPCDIKTELVTPTGAAIAGYLSKGKKPQNFKIKKSAYGAGKKEFENRPNLLRVMLGDTEDNRKNTVTVIETNIDTMTGEGLGFVIEKLLEAGVNDAFYTPIQMKKNRPAVKLTVIVRPENVYMAEDIIFKHTNTLGIRKYNAERTELERKQEIAKTSFGDIKIKIAEYGGLTKIRPELEEIRRICNENNLSYQRVYDKIMAELETRRD